MRAPGGHRSSRALALSAETFRQFAVGPPIPGFDLDQFERHSTRVAHVARAICEDRRGADAAFAAGLLHDVGLLVMACQDRDELGETIAAARTELRPLVEVERERYQVTHAEVGERLPRWRELAEGHLQGSR